MKKFLKMKWLILLVMMGMSAMCITIYNITGTTSVNKPPSLNATIDAIPQGTSRTKIEDLLRKFGFEYKYHIPTKKDIGKDLTVFDSGVPLLKAGGAITIQSSITQTRSCVSFSQVFILIFDKNDMFIKFVKYDRCVERIF